MLQGGRTINFSQFERSAIPISGSRLSGQVTSVDRGTVLGKTTSRTQTTQNPRERCSDTGSNRINQKVTQPSMTARDSQLQDFQTGAKDYRRGTRNAEVQSVS
jgi:hypothetical protein